MHGIHFRKQKMLISEKLDERAPTVPAFVILISLSHGSVCVYFHPFFLHERPFVVCRLLELRILACLPDVYSIYASKGASKAIQSLNKASFLSLQQLSPSSPPLTRTHACLSWHFWPNPFLSIPRSVGFPLLRLSLFSLFVLSLLPSYGVHTNGRTSFVRFQSLLTVLAPLE